ncbi:hypothetical protein CEXT_115001, partial [Caerostris extrusa]
MPKGPSFPPNNDEQFFAAHFCHAGRGTSGFEKNLISETLETACGNRWVISVKKDPHLGYSEDIVMEDTYYSEGNKR